MNQNPKELNFPILITRGTFPLPQDVTCSLSSVKACKHVLYGFWAPTYLVPPYRKWVQGEGTETQ